MADIGGIHYDVIDMTPPWRTRPDTIVFHHGVGTDADIWCDWLPVLAGRYRLVRFDMRGCGRSGRAGLPASWTFDVLMDDLFAVADAVDAGDYHLVGESIGGTAALYAALNRSERLKTVTTVSTSHRGGSIRHVEEWRGYIAAHGMEGWSEQMMEQRFVPGALAEDAHAWFAREQAGSSPEVVLGLAEMLVGTDLSGELAAIDLPVLILSPDGSPFVPVALAADIRGHIDGSELRVFPGTRHGLAFSHAADCAQTLLEFLSRHG